MGKRNGAKGLAGVLALSAIAASCCSALGGCSRAAAREQYLMSRETAAQPRIAAGVDRPIGLFASVTGE